MRRCLLPELPASNLAAGAVAALASLILLTACDERRPSADTVAEGNVSYVNPQELHRNPAFSQMVVVSGPTRTVYIGGQNAVDGSGTIVGRGDIGAQAEQVPENLLIALAAADTTIDNVVKWTVYVRDGHGVEE